MSTFLIDSTLQNIVFNGYDVQRLIYNSNLVWEKGSGPTPIDYSKEYFTITSWENNNTINFHRGRQANYSNVNMELSYDKETWITITGSASYSFTLGIGEKAYLRGTNTSLNSGQNESNATIITANKLFEVSGNIMSTLYGDNFEGQTTASGNYTFCCMFSHASTLLTALNLVLPCTTYNQYIYQAFMIFCDNLIYVPKELPQETSQGGASLVWYFGDCPKIQDTGVIRVTSNPSSGTGWTGYITRNCNGLKRAIFLLNSGYPWVPTGCRKYKSAANTGTAGTVFSENPNDYVHIWAEPEIPYSGYIEGCSDYYLSGDTVTLKATGINNYTFNGWYDNGVLVSSNIEYSFTASTNKNLVCKFAAPRQCFIMAGWVPSGSGVATGGGYYYTGDTATLTAVRNAGYKFVGWYDSNNTLVSTSNPYSFTVTDDLQIYAHFEESQTVYTEVDCLKTDTTGYNFRSIYFNTNINTGNYDKLEITVEYMPLVNDGNIFFGHNGADITSSSSADSNDCRLFYYSNSVYVDVGSSRYNVSDSFNSYKKYKWTINKTTGKWSLYNVTTESYVISEQTISNTINNYPIYICPSPMKFKSILIKGNDIIVFNGISVLDENDNPCIYDSVSGKFFYPQGTYASNITYEA